MIKYMSVLNLGGTMNYYLAEQKTAGELDGYLQLTVTLVCRAFVVGMLVTAFVNLDTLIPAFLGS